MPDTTPIDPVIAQAAIDQAAAASAGLAAFQAARRAAPPSPVVSKSTAPPTNQ